MEASDNHLLQRLLAIHEIQNLQSRYMYYLEAHRYDDVLNLFASSDPGVSVEIGEGGVYQGRDKVEAMFLQVLKPFFTLPGMMPVHMLTTPVVEVTSDYQQGAAMWQTLGCNSFPENGELKAVW